MIKNYLKIALRNLIRHKTFSFINIFGLALGMTGVFLILLWVMNEISYDRFHANGGNICKVFLSGRTGNETITVGSTFGPMAVDMLNRYPEVANSTRYYIVEEARVRVGWDKNNGGDKLFMERNMAAADPSFLSMFSFPLLKGDIAAALANPNSILLTENMVKKYFGNINPVGRSIIIDDVFSLQVTGVLKNVPGNSEFRFDFLVPASYIEGRGGNINTYDQNNCQIFLQLKDGAMVNQLTKKIQEDYDKTLPESGLLELKHHLMPFEDVHLYSSAVVPRIAIVYIFIVLAFFILLIACINFINLSTARSILRLKEIGLKKVVGARRSQLVWQFLSESIIIAAIALVISVTLLELTLPSFNQLIQSQLGFSWFDTKTWFALLLIIILTGLIAGSYPAFYMSSFTPNRILRGQLSLGKTGEAHYSRARLRKILVVSQFALTVILVINIINTARWDKYLNELGFEKDNIIYLQNRGKNYDVFKTRLLADQNISQVTTASHLPLNMFNILGSAWGLTAEAQNSPACMAWTGYDYLETFKLKMLTGRFFSAAYPSDEADGIIVNEKAVKVLNTKTPIGQQLYIKGEPYTIIGVVQDFHFIPKVFEIKPLILRPAPGGSNWVFIKMKEGDKNTAVVSSAATIKWIEAVYKEFYPAYPFEYQYLSEYQFNEEKMMATVGKVVIGFAVFGIVVAALGLFGLSLFLVEQRTKEIGIRKVLGASKFTILNILTSEFFKLILIANILAWPVAYFIENQLDQIFVYKLDFAYWMFAAAGFFSLLIAFAAVYFQVIRAANANPVESLKYE